MRNNSICFRSLLAAVVLTLAPPAIAAEEKLVRLAEVGPWHAVSGLISYRGRLWFANAVKFRDHNSADIYSYAPEDQSVRYERHLMSQDAGTPVVYAGLLYWPFEDPRWSAGRGEYMVTNGRDWAWHMLPQREAFHIHAMAERGLDLYASTSAFRAGLQKTRDRGRTWEPVWEYAGPTEPPNGGLTRIYSMIDYEGALHVGFSARWREDVSLLRLDGGALEPVPGWPKGQDVRSLTVHRGKLYAINIADNGRAVWRTDGKTAERIVSLDGVPVRKIASAGETIWAISMGDATGSLWRSRRGTKWVKVQDFPGLEPVDLAVWRGKPWVGILKRGGMGQLWGPADPGPAEAARRVPPLPDQHRLVRPDELQRLLESLDRTLGDVEIYRQGRHRTDALRRLALGGDAAVGAELLRRLDRPYPEDEISIIGGNLKLPAQRIARHYLMWAMAMNGKGRVPLDWFDVPFEATPNRSQKYLHPVEAAAWAAAAIGQDDRHTVRAMIDRLAREDDPQWLKGDLVGALSVLTKNRFGYDFEAWAAYGKSLGNR